MEPDLREAVMLAAADPAVGKAVGEVYAQLQQAIDGRKPICSASGKCCNFEAYGHRLYVTTLELAKFVADRAASAVQISNLQSNARQTQSRSLSLFAPAAELSSTAAQAGCPFQISGLCSVHSIRPFGCRVFFCDPTSTQWQQDQYEQHHATLRRLHDELEVPYFYVEWRYALQILW